MFWLMGRLGLNKTYPSGFMDIVSIPKTTENFRLLYDTKGRFRLHSIRDEEAKYAIFSALIIDWDGANELMFKFHLLCFSSSARSGIETVLESLRAREKHKGSFETVHIQDALGHEFATRLGMFSLLAKGTKPWVSLPKGKGIKLSIIEEARKRLQGQQINAA
uniref:Uncharacterized protein n=1 Tax=Fagus sylvatica TaxID=28930 RepID=A0A2N9FG23_FAGSY